MCKKLAKIYPGGVLCFVTFLIALGREKKNIAINVVVKFGKTLIE